MAPEPAPGSAGTAQFAVSGRLIDKSGAAMELARKEYNPDFDIRISYGQRDKSPDGMQRSDLVSLTVAMNLPVWGTDKIEPRIAEALPLSPFDGGVVELAASLYLEIGRAPASEQPRLVDAQACLAVAIGLAVGFLAAGVVHLHHQGAHAVFVSKDLSARIKSDALGIRTEDFENQKVDAERLNTGFLDLVVDRDLYASPVLGDLRAGRPKHVRERGPRCAR